jgi:hypothetical protein
VNILDLQITYLWLDLAFDHSAFQENGWYSNYGGGDSREFFKKLLTVLYKLETHTVDELLKSEFNKYGCEMGIVPQHTAECLDCIKKYISSKPNANEVSELFLKFCTLYYREILQDDELNVSRLVEYISTGKKHTIVSNWEHTLEFRFKTLDQLRAKYKKMVDIPYLW